MARQSLRTKLVLFSCLIALVVAGVSYAVYFYAVMQMARDTVLSNLRSLQDEVELNLSNDLSAIDRAAKNIIRTNTVYNHLQNGAPSLAQDALAQSVLRTGVEKDMTSDLLFDAAFTAGLIENVHLYLSDTNIAFLSRNNRSSDKDMPQVRSIYNTIRGERFWGMRCFSTLPDDPLLYFAYCIYPLSTDASNRNMYLILSTAKSNFDALFAPLLTHGGAQVFVCDANGMVLVSSDASAQGAPIDPELRALSASRGFAEGNYRSTPCFLSVAPLGNGYRSVTLLPTSSLNSGVHNMTFRYLILCVCVLAATTLLVLPMSLGLTQFTRDFVKGIRRFGSGDFSARLPAYRDNDLNEISATFNQMTEEITELIREKYEKQMLLQQMDIDFLQSQMHPHFLFNVLLSISARAKMSRDETLFEMVQSLTRLLQASLHQKNAVKIPLQQELEYVQAYLNIQRLRFGNRISFTLDIDSDTLGLLIPRLSVQPLVENAVLHGLAPREDGGLIQVRSFVENEELFLLIEDDGCGFDPARQPPPSPENHNHIALSNLCRRMELIYGPPYGLIVQSAPNKGCSVTLRLPKEEDTRHALQGDPC